MRGHSRPSDALLGELREVASSAIALAEHVRGDNTIPYNFPKIQLITVAEALSSLSDTTTASAAILLEYASRRIPAIRREYVRHDAGSAIPGERPELTRGASLDTHLKNVIAAVGTALDECRREAALQPEEDNEPLEHRIDTSADPETAVLLKQSAILDRSAKEVVEELHRSKQPDSKRADDLERNVRGIKSISNAAGAELQSDGTVVPWLKRLGRGISNYPAIIKSLGQMLERGGDIAAPAWNRWERAWHGVGETLIEQTTAFGKDLQKVVQKWETKNNGINGDAVGADAESAQFRTLVELSHDKSLHTRRVAMEQLVNRFPSHPGTPQRLKEMLVEPNAERWGLGPLFELSAKLVNDPTVGDLLKTLFEKSNYQYDDGKLIAAMLVFQSNLKDPQLMHLLNARVTAPRGVPLRHKRDILRAIALAASCNKESHGARKFLIAFITGNNQRTSLNAIQCGAVQLLMFPDIQAALIKVIARSADHWNTVCSIASKSPEVFVLDDELCTQLKNVLKSQLTNEARAPTARSLLTKLAHAKAKPSPSTG